MKRNVSYFKGYLFCVFTLALILCSTSAFGAIIRVPGDQPTIQAGIDAASSADTVLVADGTYTGPGNKNLNFLGKAITVQSENGPENCIIDCEGVGRGLFFQWGEWEDSLVSGFTIKNGQVGDNAIQIDNSSPTITNCTITGNGGGGVFCMDNSSPTIIDCTITSNGGSGIFPGTNSSPTITNCIITGNTADYGGGIHVYNASPTITNCTITGNTTVQTGAIHGAENSFLTIINCMIADNIGGGINLYSSSATITNCTITGNSRSGIDLYNSSSTITNCILWADSPPEIIGNPLVSYSDIQGGFPGEGNIDDDPLFVGGGDYHLTAGSPCIDTGTNDAPELPAFDYEGDSRVLDGNNDGAATVDMGADEYAPPTVAKSLYDDFSGTYIDSQKWRDRELVREVDPVMGKLVLKIGNPVSGEFRNRTSLQDPASINAVECEITVVATNLDTGTDPMSFVRIEGIFYNTQVSGGATGDIGASVYIGDRGSGLEAFWEVGEALDDDLTSWEQKGTGTLIGPGTLVHGNAYTVKIEYDGDNGFTFTAAGVSAPWFFGPARERPAVTLSKGLAAGINSYGGSGVGYVSALFDNVYINNEATPYDTFNSAPLDQTKWQHLEYVREISAGKLRLNVQSQGSQADATIEPTNQIAAYLEAKVLVESGSQVSPGATGIARIAGWYYNDSRGPGSGQDYNGYEGDIWIDNRIILDESNNLMARSILWRSDFDPSSGTTIDMHYFITPIAFDTEYALSIEFTGSSFIFKCNDETYRYSITTPTYPPSGGQYRQLKSRVYADPGASGYMKAHFDDVYTGYAAQATYDATGTWVATETEVEDTCDPTVQPETFTVTITQTGNDVTVVDDEGNTFTGIVNGSYYAVYGEFLEQGEPVRMYLAFTLSSSTSGSGSYNWTWTDGVDWCEGGATFTFTKEVILLSPNGGEVIPSGLPFIIQWGAPPEAVSFKLKFSMDNGKTWKPIASEIADTSYDWPVPTPKKNKKKCLVKVIGYNALGKKIGADGSDAPFTIEVLTVTSPNGGEVCTSGDPYTITWTTNGTKKPVEKVVLKYTKNGGKKWKKIETVTENTGSYDWTVPDVPKTKSKCLVKVVLKDKKGNTVGSDKSDGYFTIQPQP